VTRDQATIARLRARIAELESAWQRDSRLWAIHAEDYKHRSAIMGSARKHGATLGPEFREVLAARLVAVDVAHDETRPTMETARRLVETWSAEGLRVRRVA
jgi:hypothetical protein